MTDVMVELGAAEVELRREEEGEKKKGKRKINLPINTLQYYQGLHGTTV